MSCVDAITAYYIILLAAAAMPVLHLLRWRFRGLRPAGALIGLYMEDSGPN